MAERRAEADAHRLIMTIGGRRRRRPGAWARYLLAHTRLRRTTDRSDPHHSTRVRGSGTEVEPEC
jgi:hypothetical protein